MIINSEGEGGTPLSCAASQGHKHIINYLLEQDVDVNGAYIKSKVCSNSDLQVLRICNNSRQHH